MPYETPVTKGIENLIATWKPRSAWDKGIRDYYIPALLDTYTECAKDHERDAKSIKELMSWILNGADDWKQYSWNGCSLCYDDDIAKTLCTASEYKRTKNGTLRPNGKEEWLDVQARALTQAAFRISQVFCETTGIED